MRAVTEILLFALRDAKHYCARVSNEDGVRYTNPAISEDAAMDYAAALIRNPSTGRKTKPDVSDVVLNAW